MFLLKELKEPYKSLFEKSEWDAYIAALHEECLVWWFNMDLPSLAAYLLPLLTNNINRPITERLRFLSEAMNNQQSTESLNRRYKAFLDENDVESAAGVIGAAVMRIWEFGWSTTEPGQWLSRIHELLDGEHRLTPLALASVRFFRHTIDTFYNAIPLPEREKDAREVTSLAETAGACGLRVNIAVMHSQIQLMQADFEPIEALTNDRDFLEKLSRTAFPNQSFFKYIMGICLLVMGEGDKSWRLLNETVYHRSFPELPSAMRLQNYGHGILAATYRLDGEALDCFMAKVNDMEIPDTAYFNLSFKEFILGIGSLALSDPEKAMDHLRGAWDTWRLSNAREPEMHIAVLRGQVLSDLGRHDDALGHFHRWIPKWDRSGYRYYVIVGHLEAANIWVKEGRRQKARRYYDTAMAIWPPGRPLIVFHRPERFMDDLERRLNPKIKVGGQVDEKRGPLITVRTFGGLRIRTGGRVIEDRAWKGTKTKTLLKAVIVHGGRNVSKDILTDLLWPDKEGDLAEGSLKVTLTRLRKAVPVASESGRKWIRIRQGRVSVSSDICEIDSIRFKTLLKAGLKPDADISSLQAALDLYTDDFLPNDHDQGWINRHRDSLKNDFGNGAVALSKRCIRSDRVETALPYLVRAMDKTPLLTDVYVHLMRAYLKTGYPSMAIQVFQRAQETFNRELGVAPGPVLVGLARKAKKF